MMIRMFYICFLWSAYTLLQAQDGITDRCMKRIDRKCEVILFKTNALNPVREKVFEDTAMNITSGTVKHFVVGKKIEWIEKKFIRDSVCKVSELYVLCKQKVIRYTSNESCRYFSETIKTSDTYYFKNKKLLAHLRKLDGYVKETKVEHIPVGDKEGGFILADYSWWYRFLHSDSDYMHFETY
jgi:hypothetical protein